MRCTALRAALWFCCCWHRSSFIAARVWAHGAIATAATVATLADVPEQSGVLLLSHSTLTAAVQMYQPLFLLLDAPTRRGSLELFRAFADAAVALRASDVRMRFGAIDVLEPSDTLDRLNVVGLPALVRLQCPPKVATLVGPESSDEFASTTGEGAATATISTSSCSLDDVTVESYTGGRTSAEFQRFMLAQPQRDVLTVRDAAALHALVTAQPVVVLIVVDGRDTQPYFDAIALAQADASSSVYAVSANLALLPEVLEPVDALAPVSIPSLVLFRDFGATRVQYAGPWRKRAIVRFVQLNKYSAVSTYASAFPSVLFDPKAAAHVLLFADVSASYCDALLAQTQAIALPYASALLSSAPLRFVLVGAEETALRAALFVADRHVPTVLVVETVGDPPLRFPLVSEQLVAALETAQFSAMLGEWLDAKYPLVFQTGDVTDGDNEDDGDANGDTSGFESFAFESEAITMSPDDAGHPGDAVTQFTSTSDRWRDALAVHRALREVAVAVDSDAPAAALSPWEVYRQEQSLVQHVTSVHWIRTQQAAGVHDVVVSFSSPRCYACRAFAGVLEHAARASAAAATRSVVFATVNVDDVDVTALGLAFTRLPSVYAFPRCTGAAPVLLSSQTLSLADVLAFVDAVLEK